MSLKRIGNEAFWGTDHSREITIPDGVTEIGSRAFGPEDLGRIYIPDSVTYIAEDAFPWAVVVSSAGSCAHDYAVRRGLPWESTSPWQPEDVEDYLNTPGEPGGMDPLELLDRISADDITDPEDLARLDGYNEQLDALNLLLGEYNDLLDEIQEKGSQCLTPPEMSASQDSGACTVSFSGTNMSMDASFMDAMNGGIGISAMEASSDGSYSTLELENGASYRVAMNGSDISIAATSSVASSGASPKAVRLLSSGSGSALDALTDKLDAFTTWINTVGEFLQDKVARLIAKTDELENAASLWEASCKQEAKTGNKIIADRLKETGSRIKDRLKNASVSRTRWTSALAVWGVLDLAGSALSLRQIIVRGQVILNIINCCQHPNDLDMIDDEAYRMASQMNRDMRKLLAAYVADGIICIVDLWTTATMFVAAIPTGGASMAGKIAIAAVKTAVGLFLNSFEDNLYAEIMETERLLHTFVEGHVYDRKTQEAIRSAVVTMDDGRSTVTDDDGHYLFHMFDFSQHSMTAQAQEYLDSQPVTFTAVKEDTVWKTILLSPVQGLVTGTIYNEVSGMPVPDVAIYDESGAQVGQSEGEDDSSPGWYYVNLPLSGGDLTFKKYGFRSTTVHVDVYPDTPVVRDVQLAPYPGIPLTDEYFPDEAFREFLRSRFDRDDNDILSAEENAYITYFSIPEGTKSIAGLEYLFFLKYLNIKASSLEGTLEVKNLESVEKIIFDGNPNLTGLVISQIPTLTYIQSENNIINDWSNLHSFSLTVKDCSKLNHILAANGLLNQCTVSNCPKLDKLEVHNNRLTSFRMSGVPALTLLSVSDNQLTDLDVSAASDSLHILYCSNNHLASLDLDCCSALTTIACQDNPITVLNLRDCCDDYGGGTYLRAKESKTGPDTAVNMGCEGIELTVYIWYVASPSTWQINGNTFKKIKRTVREGVYTIHGDKTYSSESGPVVYAEDYDGTVLYP